MRSWLCIGLLALTACSEGPLAGVWVMAVTWETTACDPVVLEHNLAAPYDNYEYVGAEWRDLTLASSSDNVFS